MKDITAASGIINGKDHTTAASKTNPANVGYSIDTDFLPAAKTLTSGDTKTIQINASSDETSEVSYSLVAPYSLTDANVGNVPAASSQSKTYYWNPLTNHFSGDLDHYSLETTATGYTAATAATYVKTETN